MFPETARLANEEEEDEEEDEDDASGSDSDSSDSGGEEEEDSSATAPCDESGQRLCSLDNYLVRLGQVSKVQQLCLQLRKDIAANTHRYIAHQLVLLFQILARVVPKPQTADFKRRIEERFLEVKAAIDTAQKPLLPPDLCAWADTIATDILACIVAPPSLGFMAPVCRFLTA